MSNAEFEKTNGSGKWSRKQILGHLIDSAVNNHHRFIRAQFESHPVILYDQDKWNQYGHYQQMHAQLIVNIWSAYNLFLSALLQNIPPSAYENTLDMGDGKLLSLASVVEDYVTHLEHHLHQIVNY